GGPAGGGAVRLSHDRGTFVTQVCATFWMDIESQVGRSIRSAPGGVRWLQQLPWSLPMKALIIAL
ncbi:MAG: hypothetical protein SVM79_06325, partial [Chloroflexota bacterium]|nr:hypothetical protein [Chloroflexota bacterium]